MSSAVTFPSDSPPPEFIAEPEIHAAPRAGRRWYRQPP